MKRTLFDPPADLHCSVITQKPAYLACYLRHGIGRKLRSEPGIEARNGFKEAEAAELIQIVRLNAAAEKAPRNAPDKPRIILNEPLGRRLVPLLRKAQIVEHALGHRKPLRWRIVLSIVTVVPLPGVLLTFSLSIKLSIMVKPIPLRSSPPVVYIGSIAC